MPGILGLVSAHPLDGRAMQRFARALASMCNQPDDATRSIASDVRLLVGAAGRDSYPVRVLRAPDCTIIIEGQVYSERPNVVDKELTVGAEVLFGDKEKRRKWVSRQIMGWDGDYVIMAVSHSRSELVVFSDALGRLPLYYYCDEHQVVVGRRLKAVRHLAEQTAFDEIALGQVLWFGYPLGGRTLVKRVSTGPPSLLLHCVIEEDRLMTTIESLVVVNFENQAPARGASEVRRYGGDVADLVTSCCREVAARCSAAVNVVSLSGGMDSRAVAAGMTRAGSRFAGATFKFNYDGCGQDVAIAEQVARALHMGWERYELPESGEDDWERLAELKDGLNFAGMAFILKFFDMLACRWGDSVLYLTGDGGGSIKACPHAYCGSTTGTVELTCGSLRAMHALGEDGAIEEYLGLRKGVLRQELSAIVCGFPERTHAGRLAHFEVYERERRWQFEGEDRNRQFFWSAAPLTSWRLFSYCAAVPAGVKRNNRLYRQVQIILSPEAASLSETYSGVAPASPLYCPTIAGMKLGRRVKSWMKKMVQSGDHRRDWHKQGKELAYVLAGGHAGASLCNNSSLALDRFLCRIGRAQLLYLVTITAVKNVWSKEGLAIER